MTTPRKISFCTTCRGPEYLARLQKTLPENLRLNSDNNVEFVIVAYGDPTVTQWLKEKYSDEIKSGRIRAVDVSPEHAPFFKMAHAKTVAHRMATGDVLCNLDCDNITGENFAKWLRNEFSKNPNIVACATTRDKLNARIRTGVTPRDITGRIAISRENFEQLHGYDETRNAAKDGDDTNFKERAYASGLKSVSFPPAQFGTILPHSDEERSAHMSPQDKEKTLKNVTSTYPRTLTIIRVLLGEHRVIPVNLCGAAPNGDFGCTELTILDENLTSQPHTLSPANHPKWKASFDPPALLAPTLARA